MAQTATKSRVRDRVRWRQSPVPPHNMVNLKEKSAQKPAPTNAKRRPSHEGPRHEERHPHETEVRERIEAHEDDARYQHELEEMRETHDLDDVDDDVEQEATLLEWYAEEHTHRPKSPAWFAILAAGTTIAVGLQLFFFANFIGALTLAFVGGLTYYIAQQKPQEIRYRLMLDGIALNNTLYHYQDLDAFNIVYEPDETKTALFRSNRRFAPLIHMELGEADPNEIRGVLVEFLPEDFELEEPLVDIFARRAGF